MGVCFVWDPRELPGPCQGHGTPPAIVLGAAGSSFLTKEEMGEHQNVSLSFPPYCQGPDVGPSWPPARGSHPGLFRPTLCEIHVLPITSFPWRTEGCFTLYYGLRVLRVGVDSHRSVRPPPLPLLCPHVHLQPLLLAAVWVCVEP